MPTYRFELDERGQVPSGFFPCSSCRWDIKGRDAKVTCEDGHEALVKHLLTDATATPAATVEEPAAPAPPLSSILRPSPPMAVRHKELDVDALLEELDEKEDRPKKGKKK